MRMRRGLQRLQRRDANSKGDSLYLNTCDTQAHESQALAALALALLFRFFVASHQLSPEFDRGMEKESITW